MQECRQCRAALAEALDAVCRFVEPTGGMAAIGSLDDAVATLAGQAGTIVTVERSVTEHPG